MKWIILIVVIAVSTAAVISLRSSIDIPGTTLAERERRLTGVIVTGTSSTSQIHYTIESQILIEYPEKDYGDLESPRVVQIHADGLSREVTADKGRYFKDENMVVLNDNVVIVTKSSEDSEPVLVTTDEYTLNLNTVN